MIVKATGPFSPIMQVNTKQSDMLLSLPQRFFLKSLSKDTNMMIEV